MGDHYMHRKTYAYEGSARIPLLVRYPSTLDLPGGVYKHVVGLQDVMPTVLDLLEQISSASVDAPAAIAGSGAKTTTVSAPRAASATADGPDRRRATSSARRASSPRTVSVTPSAAATMRPP